LQLADRTPERLTGFCRDCLQITAGNEQRCRNCRSPRLIRHPELFNLSIAHIDCDAFYAAVEKRDNPELADKPLIIGGQKRGVVSTACYLARINGVKSAMPMFKALKLCPGATVLKPNMAKYSAVGRQVRQMMRDLTPMVEPLSIDEAFLDLTGTARLHRHPPAISLADLARRIEREVGITVSIGLSHNKFLAKIASDLDKPRGMSVIGREETLSFLARQPVNLIWGVGKATQRQLAKHGITSIGQLQRMEKTDLMRQFSSMGLRLYHLSRGQDARRVSPSSEAKSISAETTFNDDITDYSKLERILWNLAEKVSRRAKKAHLAGETVTLKLKTASFRTRTRNTTLSDPTLLADRIFHAAQPLLAKEADGTAFRLIGVGISHLHEVDEDPALHDLDVRTGQRAKAELAMDKLRERFGTDAVELGRGFKPKP
jgi:DNA polymerase-4